MQTFSKRAALRAGWERFKERPFFLIGLFVLVAVLSGLSGAVAETLTDPTAVLAANLFDFALQIVLGMGMTLILLRVYDGVHTDYGDIIEPLRLFWRYLVMSILLFIIVGIGFVLFIVPGIIAAVALAYASYLVIDRSLGPVEAMHESVRITHGHRWNIFVFGVVLLLLNFAGALFFGIGLLVTVPVSALALVHTYRWLENPGHVGAVTVSAASKVAASLVTLAALVVLAWVVLTMNTVPGGGPGEQRDEQRRTDLVGVKLAAELYEDRAGRYPDTLSTLVPEYLEVMPRDPETGEPYSYTVYRDGEDFEVCAILEVPDGSIACEYGETSDQEHADPTSSEDDEESRPEDAGSDTTE